MQGGDYPIFKEDIVSNLVVIPLQKLDDLPDRLGWEAVYHNGRPVGLRNPKIGSFIMHAVMRDGQFLYDLPVHEDGPLDENGIATPGAVVVPVRILNGVHLTRSVVEWRPAIRNPNTGQQGVEIHGLPGGFAKQVGQPGTEAAFHQAMRELGIRIKELTLLGRASSNRAFASTCIRYYVATYELAGEGNPEEYEQILGSLEYPLHEFPLGLDGIVNTAIAFAWRYFDMVRTTSNGN